MLRSLARDVKQFPATMALGALWIVVFVLMIVSGLRHGHAPSLRQVFLIGLGSGHRFGDLTLRELVHGEAWRTLTCTFVHYGFLHIGLNLLGLYQLGTLVESWYGAPLSLAIYVLIGSGGNLLSGLARLALGSNPDIHSGGGSTVLMGLVGLCAVVGWRSKTRVGEYLHRQMVLMLAITALLGVAILVVTWMLGQMWPIIDNWGHAGGTLVGAAIGFAHRPLIQASKHRAVRWAGAIAALLLVGCGAAQVRVDRVEDGLSYRWQSARETCLKLFRIQNFYQLAAARGDFEQSRFVDKSFLVRRPAEGTTPRQDDLLSLLTRPDATFRKELQQSLDALDSAKEALGTGPTAADFARLRALLARSLARPPTIFEREEFRVHMIALLRRAFRDCDEAQSRFKVLGRQGRL
ncbi:MAG: rhomboid family intramembrane serine protease, partial [Singulisphaera sp.]|nr:rhomboid family intramembrane serine protease [Singulisphaera sp.]